MPTCLRGWRRKLGVITLVVACVIMVGWIRSLTTEDFIASDHLLSRDGLLQYVEWYPMDVTNQVNAAGIQIMTAEPRWDEPLVKTLPKARLQRLLDFVAPKIQWQIPYWSIVSPLTLLSACLLLSKPRPRKPPESTKHMGADKVTHA